MSEEATVEYFTKDNTSGEYVPATLPTFRDSIPEDLRESDHFKEMDSVEALARALHETKTNQPTIPEKPEDYELPDVPSNVPLDQDALKRFQALAHEAKLPAETFKKLVAFDVERARQLAEDYENHKKKSEDALKTKWGAEYDQNIEKASAALRNAVGEERTEAFKSEGFLDNPIFIELMHHIGEVISEDAFRHGRASQNTGEQIDPATGKPILTYPSMQE